jgi:hypothetical protein
MMGRRKTGEERDQSGNGGALNERRDGRIFRLINILKFSSLI